MQLIRFLLLFVASLQALFAEVTEQGARTDLSVHDTSNKMKTRKHSGLRSRQAHREPVKLIKDRMNVTCDDSCEFSLDGVCDDGSQQTSHFEFMSQATSSKKRKVSPSSGAEYYYMESEDYQVSACVEGTDCTDCGGGGGGDAVIDPPQPVDPQPVNETCVNTCFYPRDGICDDPRGTRYCPLGTDCQDCGPVGADNFTRSTDDGWWDDDVFNPPSYNESIPEPIKISTSSGDGGNVSVLFVLAVALPLLAVLATVAALLVLYRQRNRQESQQESQQDGKEESKQDYVPTEPVVSVVATVHSPVTVTVSGEDGSAALNSV